MLVIVTGPDRAGKTTLIDYLTKSINFDYFHKGLAPADKYEAEASLWSFLRTVINNPHKRYLCDRLNFPDDIIYRPVIENETSGIIHEKQHEITEVLCHMKAFFVYVTADLKTLTQRWNVLGDDSYVTLKQNEVIWAKYELFFATTKIPHVRIDTSLLTPQEANEVALNALKEKFGLISERVDT